MSAVPEFGGGKPGRALGRWIIAVVILAAGLAAVWYWRKGPVEAAVRPGSAAILPIDREEKRYLALSGFMGRWAPRLYGPFHLERWHVLLMEDVGHFPMLEKRKRPVGLSITHKSA